VLGPANGSNLTGTSIFNRLTNFMERFFTKPDYMCRLLLNVNCNESTEQQVRHNMWYGNDSERPCQQIGHVAKWLDSHQPS
jgi:hypothetical protein